MKAKERKDINYFTGTSGKPGLGQANQMFANPAHHPDVHKHPRTHIRRHTTVREPMLAFSLALSNSSSAPTQTHCVIFKEYDVGVVTWLGILVLFYFLAY